MSSFRLYWNAWAPLDLFGLMIFLVSIIGTVVDDEAKDLLGQGRELKEKESRPRKEDIVQE